MLILYIVLAVFIGLPIWISFYYFSKDTIFSYSPFRKFGFGSKVFLVLFSPFIVFPVFVYCLVRLILSKVIRIT